MRDIGKDRRFCASGGTQGVIAWVLRDGGVQKGRGMTDTATNQQRNLLFFRNPTRRVDGRDHRIPGQNHAISLNRDIFGEIILR
ncbi:hypothetical protein D3C73_1203000 [compost metagenome]